MWDWTTSILKAQVRRRKRLKAGLLVPLGSSHTPQCHPGQPVPTAHCLLSTMTSSPWFYAAVPPLTLLVRSLALCLCCPSGGMTVEPRYSLLIRPW